ncbi:MAG: bifunctional 5,10-methylenetetrahydrofolate dehydrogenase/5,10-methenyltetrahydrofolate cyclohydrolase [Candidatus Adiutrix sp.]|jgi:methylenetetrahydrofolate dehydrogenase (NADP+)/methenyltetrahydrofolate cyclohydrolase|nr:bifunctional 5,10-methylenetetrahydrofolate dehydrogenase/5,10-methenyltetrahydrofolate cyclohydrolase [Candidatus Adiutrix sp.]
MPAEIIKGLPVATAMREEITSQVKAIAAKGVQPKLAVVLVGDDEASRVYAQAKEKVGEKMGIKVDLHVRPSSTSEAEVIKLVDELNADKKVHGILVELPLPKSIQKENVMNRIDPKKDVDGVHPVNRGYLLGGQEHLALVPATPLACIELIQRSGLDLKGKKVTLVGRGDTVGRPLASLLIKRDATITVCHTKTVDLAGTVKGAEIVVAAAGFPKLVKAEMVAPGQTVIDAGINQLPDGSLCGDVDTEPVSQIVRAITPVPGGVGSLTTTVIMQNLLKAIGLQAQ